jgi:hypothetical protein
MLSSSNPTTRSPSTLRGISSDLDTLRKDQIEELALLELVRNTLHDQIHGPSPAAEKTEGKGCCGGGLSDLVSVLEVQRRERLDVIRSIRELIEASPSAPLASGISQGVRR